MGPVERTGSGTQAEADAFFGRCVDAAPEVVARVVAERGGDLAVVLVEEKAFGYWDRKIAARAARREQRERVGAAERAWLFAASALSREADEVARFAPLSKQCAATLPAPRVVALTTADVTATRRWWRRLETPRAAHGLARRIRIEVREAQRAERERGRAVAVWRTGEREFERGQWRAVITNRDSRPVRRIANRWVAIEEDRALAIAVAALEADPPQASS